MRKHIVFCLVLASNSAFAISTTLSDAINQGAQAIERVGAPKGDAPGDHSISVTGTITSPAGRVTEKLVVKAFAGKMGGNRLVGSAVTDDGGAYTIAFPSNESVTIVVKVYCKTTLLATSAPEYNVTEGASIDLTVPTSKCGQSKVKANTNKIQNSPYR